MSTGESAESRIERAPAVYLPGELIERRYRVVERVGGGAFGVVYRVVDSLTDEERALKLFRDNVSFDEVVREYLGSREAFGHPNIAWVEHIDRTTTEPSQPFALMEFVSGETLDVFCAEGLRRLSDEECLEVADQVLAALEVLHPDGTRIRELEALEGEVTRAEMDELHELKRSGLVHRDIKPQNLRRRVDGVVKIIDFGISVTAGATVMTVSATPNYFPTDADPLRWSPYVDLFAVGVILFELLTHRSPTVDAWSWEERSGLLTEARPDLGSAYVEYFSKILGDDVAERFPDATAMREATAILAGGGQRTEGTAASERDSNPPGVVQGDVSQLAGRNGFGESFERAIELSARHGLGTRRYVRSLMLTPGVNKARYLVNLEFKDDGTCNVAVSVSNWATFYGVTKELLGALEPPGRSASPPQVEVFLQRLDRLLEGRTPLQGSTQPRVATILEWLRARPGGRFTIEEIAEGTGFGRRVVGKTVSTLTSERCPSRYVGAIRKFDDGKIAAEV